MAKHYPVEQPKRAVKMVLDHLDEYRSVYAACQAIGPKVGVSAAAVGVAGPDRRCPATRATAAELQLIKSSGVRTEISRRH